MATKSRENEKNTAELEELRELKMRFTPRALRRPQEEALSKMVLTNPMQTGEDMFTLMAWAIPARARELLLMRWNDIRPIPGTKDDASIEISEAMHPFRNENNSRLVPLPSKVYDLLLKRKQGILDYYHELMGKEKDGSRPNVDIGTLPICCSGNDYAAYGNIEKMVKHCREQLLTAGVSEDTLRLMELTNKCNDNPSVRREDSAETYLLRCNFATHAYAVGLTHDEICYLMDIQKD